MSRALPLPANLALFAFAAALVWVAGVKLTGYAKTIAERTGAEQAFVGHRSVLGLGSLIVLIAYAGGVFLL
jgi:cation:H+ antiporter